jgi:hypothetical protein
MNIRVALFPVEVQSVFIYSRVDLHDLDLHDVALMNMTSYAICIGREVPILQWAVGLEEKWQ